MDQQVTTNEMNQVFSEILEKYYPELTKQEKQEIRACQRVNAAFEAINRELQKIENGTYYAES